MEAKFSIGDVVIHKPDLFGRTESIVKNNIRTFKNSHTGMCYLEDELPSYNTVLNARIENINGIDHLLIDGHKAIKGEPWSEIKPVKAPFDHFTVQTTNDDMNTLWSENQLKLKTK